MNPSDWIYGIIGGYLILMGILGVNLKLIWITFTLKIKFYDFEDLYGRTFGRILFIILGIMVLIFHFVIMRGFMFALL